MKHPDLHPEADLEISHALTYYQAHAPAEIVRDFDAGIVSAFIEIGKRLERFPRWHRTHVRKYILKRFPI